MKLDDVAEVNLVDWIPKEIYRPVREMAAKIITEDVEIRKRLSKIWITIFGIVIKIFPNIIIWKSISFAIRPIFANED